MILCCMYMKPISYNAGHLRGLAIFPCLIPLLYYRILFLPSAMLVSCNNIPTLKYNPTGHPNFEYKPKTSSVQPAAQTDP